jgi:muconolactone D-isomerase
LITAVSAATGDQKENAMDYLVTATPTGRLLDLSADDRDTLMASEREVATALIAGGTITWMWRLPDTDVSITIWNAESAEALDAHLKTLPVFPYNDVEVTALAAHPAFPRPLRATRS